MLYVGLGFFVSDFLPRRPCLLLFLDFALARMVRFASILRAPWISFLRIRLSV